MIDTFHLQGQVTLTREMLNQLRIPTDHAVSIAIRGQIASAHDKKQELVARMAGFKVWAEKWDATFAVFKWTTNLWSFKPSKEYMEALRQDGWIVYG